MKPQTKQGTRVNSDLKRYPLLKKHKLLKGYEFSRVYKAKQYCKAQGLSFAFLVSAAPGPKLGITIKKKWGKAHERNRFKRIVREAWRHLAPSVSEKLHLIVHPRTGFNTLSATDIHEALTTWLQQNHLYN